MIVFSARHLPSSRRRAETSRILELLFHGSYEVHAAACIATPVFLALLRVDRTALRGGAGRPVTAERIIAADKEPQNWLAHGRTYGEQRYSPLKQVNDGNVEQLGLAWSYATGTTRGLQATPIVVDGRMYATGVWSVVYALDAKTGKELWTYDPAGAARVGPVCLLRRGQPRRGALGGRALLRDARRPADSLDARTGKKRWEINTIDRTKPYTITGAPRVIKGKVLIGNGGGEIRRARLLLCLRRGHRQARVALLHGARQSRRTASRVPEMAAAAKTWTGEWWAGGGGGTVWDSMAYDPDLDTLYVGTGNGSPWARSIRSPGGGDNLYLSSILALDPDTGRLKWHYQVTPGDNWDYTATQHMILADLVIDGKTRKVLMQAPKNGFFYVIDRVTGELLSADKYIPATWASHVDMKTGRPVETPEGDWSKETQDHRAGGVRRSQLAPDVVQSADRPRLHPGDAARWHLSAIDRAPEDRQVHAARHVLESGRGLEQLHGYGLCHPAADRWQPAAGPRLPEGRDPVAKKTRWEIEYPAFWNGGLLTTAGNLLFQGTGDGRFVAYSADAGKTLWSVPTMVGIIAPPVTYSVDGEQYVAVLAGYGGAGAVTGGDPRTMASGKYLNEGHILAFKLGGKAPLPKIAERNLDIPEPPASTATAAQVENGKYKYAPAAWCATARWSCRVAWCRTCAGSAPRSTRSSSRSSTTA